MTRPLLAALLAIAGGGALAQERAVLAPPAGSEFVMRCEGGTESRWRIVENRDGRLRVESAADAEIYREGPVWGWLFGDIYDVQGLGRGRGRNRMFLVRGAAEGVASIKPGARQRFTYRWISPNGEAERTHVITIGAPRLEQTPAFGELEVYEVTDRISSPLHDLRRTVQYAPEMRMFVRFSVHNNRSAFAQSCELVSLRSP